MTRSFSYDTPVHGGAQIEIVGGEIIGRSVGRTWRISAACNVGSITPATLDATLS